jgi:imidazolonepropionase-like amidohydrolase
VKNLLTFLSTAALLLPPPSNAQKTFPENGPADTRKLTYAFINAVLHADYRTVADSATLIVREGKVVAAGRGVAVLPGAVVYDLQGKHIYPSFIELLCDYGLKKAEKPERQKFREPQFVSSKPGAYSWNEAVRPEQEAVASFAADGKTAAQWREAGFGALLTHHRDGLARGTAALVAPGEGRENEAVIKGRAAAWYSFDKGSSAQDYPGSHMGCIALLRQTFLDAAWYKAGGSTEQVNLSLAAWNANQGLPPFFEVKDKLALLRAARIGREFGVNFAIKGGGDEYQRLREVKQAGVPVIVPLKFPEAYDVSDPYDALNLSLEALKHWESAPANAARLAEAGVEIAFTSDGLKEPKEFLGQVRTALRYGLDTAAALKAMTYTPARLLGVDDSLGSLRPGMLACFIITSAELFDPDMAIYENWVLGKRHVVMESLPADVRGKYSLTVGTVNLSMELNGKIHAPTLTVTDDTAKIKGDFSYSAGKVLLRFELKSPGRKGLYRLACPAPAQSRQTMQGAGFLPDGTETAWQAVYGGPASEKPDTAKKETPEPGKVTYPNSAYGVSRWPAKGTVLFRNATVWTNEKEGILRGADVLIRDGRIEKVGTGLDVTGMQGVEVVDAAGKHLTAGIIDEHSHIAVSGPVNECTQAVTAEVRIGDAVDCDDVNIYRQLAGGVTSSHVLHGSCNPVGGQTQLLKLRWGRSPEELKFEGWPGFIKFALGENVKQSNWGEHQQTRYPQTRMGVEQVYEDAFTRAREYRAAWRRYEIGKKAGPPPRRDLELEALAEILESKRFITCHSYRQSEINMLMHLADRFGFTVNTFTHILEGYKVADKMKAHGAGASSFSDWWAYKFEVYEAIPYNGALLHANGVVTAFNSDDAEMARRLNQEAAKAVRYGGVSEEEAWKFVTLNPAKLLRVDHRVGSVAPGKDADLVLWSDHPLSIYARALQTWVDGIKYYDEKDDAALREANARERARLIGKMMEEGKKGKGKAPPKEDQVIKHCMEDEVVY